MFKRAALSLLLFTAFVFAVQERELRRLAPRLRDPVHEDTNAKRFARGLPPLPPRRNIEASRTDAARRSLPSDTQIWSGKIKVSSVKDTIGPENKALGYLALNANQTYYVVVSDLNNASTFTATLRQYGITTNVSFKDKNAPASQQYLAGLIPAGGGKLTLLGTSELTSPDSPPHGGGSVSIPGASYKTVIFDYYVSNGNLTAKWVNDTTLSIVWDPQAQQIYLSVDTGLILIDAAQFVMLSGVTR